MFKDIEPLGKDGREQRRRNDVFAVMGFVANGGSMGSGVLRQSQREFDTQSEFLVLLLCYAAASV